MSRITRAHPWMSVEELRERLKKTNDRRTVQKLLVVLNATAEPRLAQDIAEHVGVARQTVHNWMSEYNRYGPEALLGKRPRKPLKGFLTKQEENTFLEPFFQRASTGRIATTAEIKQALEERVGHRVHHTTVYRLLKRNRWRKVKPRPIHVQSNPMVQEEFKKKSRKW